MLNDIIQLKILSIYRLTMRCVKCCEPCAGLHCCLKKNMCVYIYICIPEYTRCTLRCLVCGPNLTNDMEQEVTLNLASGNMSLWASLLPSDR